MALCTVGLTIAGTGTWTPIGPSVDVHIVVDTVTNDLYALSNVNYGPLARSGDFGASWSIVPPPPV
ncbi:MAG TPA: hypothetical protein VF014_12650, partial [Casimicrobiaceae bacterium]|nr:hypothetical protein [Casimicrobiaceae bacterium]